MIDFSVIIPARYASSRLPGKPLLMLAGQPMLAHVYQRACASEAKRVVIATDDERIAEVGVGLGAQVCMTSSTHASGTDRLQEVVSQLDWYADEIVVNVQGDEPQIPPKLINQVAHHLAAEPNAGMATLAEPIQDYATWVNPNAVKVALNAAGMALYFSRAPLPWVRDAPPNTQQSLPENFPFYRHLGLYAYRVHLLNQFVTWPPAPLEMAEQLEQLRALYQGVGIYVGITHQSPPAGIDTWDDYQRVKQALESTSA
ncbi:3-deoxy-manno-octulosonate cytidylyltransferase (CMP-KDO synthetase) [Allopseudospirillum japonicum]|uniref:3-deoxy-manno-octulosonate cytidylyltransferase n=1 Tax=Allopseudospirillum japonicum TaxID=64971 RepID=A0A1H6T985_9GAMM|nr:3-deoxy-manno-octulosonate cytidylyltransferase [Allopseudospirillum japonicum]SEI76619.1 3-deoxy-manno-octulosonate cytidylyltransferase (CMP-KDO synthetase) [Allopseudospirillum japonicum]